MTPRFRPQAMSRRAIGAGVPAQPAPVGCPAWASSPCRTLARARGGGGAGGIGMIFLGNAVSTVKLVSIGLVLAGVIGLNLSGVMP
jgi:hypothetical protein